MTITFTDKSDKFTFTVKEEFLTKCPNPSDYTYIDLMTQFSLLTSLHNEHGPSVERHFIRPPSPLMQKLIDEGKYFPTEKDNKSYEFWLDGKLINREDPVRAEQMWNKFLNN